MWDSSPKGGVIPHKFARRKAVTGQPKEEPASYQLVGEVKATKAMTGRGRESVTPHKVTEIRCLLLRKAKN